MLLQGLTLTIVGMSVVFIFLTLLVFVMKLMSAFIPKYFPDATAINRSGTAQTNNKYINNLQKSVESTIEAAPVGEAEIAVVIAAVRLYSHS